jgi:hypothetical protein
VTFTLVPLSPLESAGTFQLRATTELASDTAVALPQPYDSGGFTVRYAHPIVIDGVNDFGPSDTLVSSTAGANLYVSFDDTHLYLGLEHVDIVLGGAGNRFAYFLLSTDAGLATGNPTSSDGKATFGATGKMMFQYRERIDGGSYSEMRVANGTDWNTDWGLVGKSIQKANGYLEASIELTELGAGVTDILISAYTIDYNGDGGNGYLYNMLPAAAAGPAPADLTQYVHVTLPTSTAPNDASALSSF